MTSHHGASEAEATFNRVTHPLRRVSALLLVLEALLLGGAALYALVTLPAQAADLKRLRWDSRFSLGFSPSWWVSLRVRL